MSEEKRQADEAQASDDGFMDTDLDIRQEESSDDALVFVVDGDGDRLDKLVQEALSEALGEDISRTQAQQAIKDGQVRVDGKHVKAGVKLRGGETITIQLPEDDAGEDVIEPEVIDLDIVYEDDVLAVINKKAGMVVHPGVGQESGTLVHALLGRYPQLVDMQDDPQAEGRMGIVHRLDKDTSGLMVVALDVVTLHALMAQFQARTVEKVYTALLERRPKTHTGIVDAPIGRDPKQRKRMAVVRGGKNAQTEYRIIDDNFRDDRTLVELILHTGRTHQIRVHMAFIQCPIVGDRVYGFRKQRTSLKRQFLHASRLAFEHPVTGERMTFERDLPASLRNVMEKLR